MALPAGLAQGMAEFGGTSCKTDPSGETGYFLRCPRSHGRHLPSQVSTGSHCYGRVLLRAAAA